MNYSKMDELLRCINREMRKLKVYKGRSLISVDSVYGKIYGSLSLPLVFKTYYNVVDFMYSVDASGNIGEVKFRDVEIPLSSIEGFNNLVKSLYTFVSKNRYSVLVSVKVGMIDSKDKYYIRCVDLIHTV